jgi:hypothetical protein
MTLRSTANATGLKMSRFRGCLIENQRFSASDPLHWLRRGEAVRKNRQKSIAFGGLFFPYS